MAIDVATGLELLRRPKHKASATAAWTPIDALQVSGTVLHVGEWIDGNRDFSVPRLTAPGYTIVNLAANYTVNEYANLFARIDNLFDLRYQDPTGFERPGFGVFGGIRLANR
jgi:vitamin B12 transporter